MPDTDQPIAKPLASAEAYRHSGARAEPDKSLPRNLRMRDNHWAFDVLNVNAAVVVLPRVDVVPEPENYALMLAGLGLLGFIVRRRKQRVA